MTAFRPARSLPMVEGHGMMPRVYPQLPGLRRRQGVILRISICESILASAIWLVACPCASVRWLQYCTQYIPDFPRLHLCSAPQRTGPRAPPGPSSSVPLCRVHRRLSSREPSQMCASRMSLTLSQCHILIYFHTREVCIVKTTVSSTLESLVSRVTL